MAARRLEGDAGHLLAERPDASLDLICYFDVFEHPPCALWFAEIHRVLRPGGRLIGHVPNGLLLCRLGVLG